MPVKTNTAAPSKSNPRAQPAASASSSKKAQSLTPAQQHAKNVGNDPRLVSECADRIPEWEFFGYNDKKRVVRHGFKYNSRGRKITFHEELPQYSVKNGVVYDSKGEQTGFIPMDPKSLMDKLRHLVHGITGKH